MNHTVTLAAAAVALAASVVSAQAGCAPPGKMEAGAIHTIPGMTARLAASGSQAVPNGRNAAANIVGTWLVTYTSNGSPFGQAFIQWHDDFTEWENINMPINNGNICVGAWKPVDPSHVRRLHYGWLYTDGNLTGYFIETETDKILHRNTYSGFNKTKVYNLSGTLLAEVPGTSSAVRIEP